MGFGSSLAALSHSNIFAALVLFVLALVVRFYHAFANTFDGLYGQDAYAYYNFSRELFTALSQFQPPPLFWWPLGYPTLLSGSFLLGGTSIASAQTVTLLCGALVAPLAFALAIECDAANDSNIAGWVAGLVCALGGQLVQSSIVIMADAPALMWAALASWLLVRYARTHGLVALCIASFAVGMAVWTRWQNLIFAGAWVLALFTIQSGIYFAASSRRISRDWKNWLPLLCALSIIALVLLPQLVLRSTTSAPLAGSSWLEGWSPANFFARSFDTVDGHFDYPLPVALFYGQVLAHPAYLIALLTPLLLLGAIRVARQFSNSPHVAILLLGWSGGMLLFLAGIPYENFRFGLGLFVPLAVLTGLGAGWLWKRWHASQLRWMLVAWIGVAMLIMVWWQPRVLEPILAIKASENARLAALKLLPDEQMVWTLGFTGPIETYTNLPARDLWQVTPDEIKSSAPAYLFLDIHNIETQWRDREPYQLYQALLQSNTLEPLTQIQNWTLFRIR